VRLGILPAIPDEMLSRHSNPGVLAVKLVQRFEVLKNDLSLERAQERRCELITQVRIDITEDPWCALRYAAEHYSFCAGEIKYCARFLWRIDVAIRKQRNRERAPRAPDGVVFCIAAKKIRARAPVNAERGDAGGLRKRCDARSVAMLVIDAGA